MSSTKSVKCKICGKKYVSKDALIGHIEKVHGASIPEGWNAARYENYLRTGKTEGRCVYCGKETGWNDVTGKYNRMCGSESCKKKARDLANKNYVGKHGKTYSINDPEQQKKMVYARKNSGKYIFEDEDTGKKYVAMYDSSYGRDFLEMIDTFLNWDGADIIAPSPHTYYYEYEGKKHFYIPDVYSTSLNLEIELKDGGDNPNNHPKIQAVDKVKEQKKDELMASLKDQVNYIKICNKDYSEFFALLSRLKEKDICQLPKWEGHLESISESLIEITPEEPEEVTFEGGFPMDQINFLKRNKLLKDPMLNYDKLLDYYRKQLFHKNLNQRQWAALYDELLHVRDYLKGVVNNTYTENDQRMEYEAKKALKQVEEFIYYMEQKDTSRMPVAESRIVERFTHKWYHLVPKGADVSTGILSPWYMATHNKEEMLPGALDKYRARLVSKDFNIYPGRDPESLTVDEIIDGLNKMRGEYGDRCIYMFRYPPHYGMGKTMDGILAAKDLYEIDLNKVNDIEYIDYGRMFSHGDGEPLTKEYYDTISPEEYFAHYDDTIGMVFSRLNHISVATTSGYIPKKALRKISIPKRMDGNGPYEYKISVAESVSMEVSTVSKIDKDYQSKGNKKLTDFRRVGIDDAFIRKHKDTYNTLKHIDTNDNAVAWLDDNKLVAIAAVDESYDPDGVVKMITAIEVMPEYQGYGLGSQVLNYAVRTLKGNALCVSTKNEVAQKMYKDYGFKYSETSKKLVESGESKMYMMYYGINMEATIMEACKNVDEARKFVWEVGKLAKKYDANYFLVTDGASGTSNGNGGVSNPAVKNARDQHTKWEKKHGYDPDEDWGSQFESTFIEAAKDDTLYYPVFIFLSYTGTNMAKLIKAFTHDPYSHSSLSFDTELTNMVSFNREGMVTENIKDGLWKERAGSIKYSLYMYLATAEEYDAMRNFVNELLGKRSKLKYNTLGLTNFIFGRGSDREDKFFCSEFVASVITAGDKKVIKTKPYMTSPYMLAKNKNFKFIKKGLVKNYDPKVVDNIIKDYLEEGGYTNVVIR
jgi:ribosomal protein S18 acetylase RimI-like enzyme